MVSVPDSNEARASSQINRQAGNSYTNHGINKANEPGDITRQGNQATDSDGNNSSLSTSVKAGRTSDPSTLAVQTALAAQARLLPQQRLVSDINPADRKSIAAIAPELREYFRVQLGSDQPVIELMSVEDLKRARGHKIHIEDPGLIPLFEGTIDSAYRTT